MLRRQDAEALKAFYERYGFKGLVQGSSKRTTCRPSCSRRRSEAAPARGGLFEEPDLRPSQATNLQYDTIFTWDAVRRAGSRGCEAAELVALDTETNSLDEMRADIVGLSFSHRAGQRRLHPARRTTTRARRTSCRATRCWRGCKPWLENPARSKLGQHIKYDRHVFANHGIEVQGYAHDTMLQSYVLEVHKPHGLASLAERHLGRSGIDYETIVRQGRAPDPVLRR